MRQNSLVIQRQPWHANFTEVSHLANRMLVKPDMWTDTVRRAFSSELYSENPMTAKLEGMGAVRTIKTDEFTWMLRGANMKPAVYIGTAAGSAQGANRMAFDLPLDEASYLPGDILTPGDARYQVRIQSGPTKLGTKSVYRVKIVTDDNTVAVPAAFLKPGAKWGKLFSKYEEGATQSGSVHFAAPYELRSRISKVRKQMSMTRDADNQVLTMKVVGDDGNTYGTWFGYAETVFWKQFYREIDNNLWYSRNTTTVEGSTGRTIKSGPGVLQLLEESNTFKFNRFSGTLLQEFLSDIQTNRLTPGSPDRRVVIGTGEYGMKLIHEAGANMLQKTGYVVVNDINQQKVASPFHDNAYSVGFQIVQLKFANGAVVDLMHVPQFDNPNTSWGTDPVTGYPYESMRMVILDMNGKGPESNIKMVRKENGMQVGYVSGFANPSGQPKSPFMAHAGEYYEMHALDHVGIMIEDVTACGMLEPIRNY